MDRKHLLLKRFQTPEKAAQTSNNQSYATYDNGTRRNIYNCTFAWKDIQCQGHHDAYFPLCIDIEMWDLRAQAVVCELAKLIADFVPDGTAITVLCLNGLDYRSLKDALVELP